MTPANKSGSMQDLNSILFNQLSRLSAADMSTDQIESEVKRSTAIVGVADTIIDNAKTQLVAAKIYAEHGAAVLPMLPQISGPRE